MPSPIKLSDVSFSIVIVTRNRLADLRRAIQSSMTQKGETFEILVFDDASDDGTEAIMRAEYSNVRYFRSDEHVEVAVLRNRGFEVAKGDFIVSLDDDSYFSSENCLRQLKEKWEANPKAGALAISYFEPNRSPQHKFMPPTDDGCVLRSYVACSASLRRHAILNLGGYRECFLHQGEERHLCLRLLASGHEVIYVVIEPIVHVPSPRRDNNRLAYLGVRNTLLFDLLNIPFPMLITRFAADSIQLFRYRLTITSLGQRTWILVRSIFSSFGHVGKRSPVPAAVFRRFRLLPLHGPCDPASERMPLPSPTGEIPCTP